jgi:hypothetical protein
MGKISEKLKRSLSEVAEFKDDDEIKEFLVELGLLNRFSADATGPAGEKTMIQSATEVNHGTHFISVFFWTGYDEPEQNGYRLWAFPKSLCNLKQFVEIHQKLSEAIGGRGQVVSIEPFSGQQAFPSN